METTGTELIVLNHTKVGESNIVVHTLSPEFGRRSFILSNSRKAPMALLLPLNIVSAEIVPNSKSDLWRARNLRLEHPLVGLHGNVSKSAVAMFISEVLYRVVREGTYEEGLYEWCRGSILTLDALQSDWANYPLLFLLELAGALGFAATIDDLAPFTDDRYEEFLALTRCSRTEALLLPLSGAVRNSMCQGLLRYLSFHTDSRIEIRSLGVLREMWR